MTEFGLRRQGAGELKGKKRRITRKEYQRLFNKFEMECFMAQKGLWNLVEKKVLQERGALPQEEGDVIREYKAMHVKNVMTRGKEEQLMEIDKEIKEEMGETIRKMRKKRTRRDV